MPSEHLPLDNNVQASMNRFLRLKSVFSMDEFLSGWFHGTPSEGILRDNVEEFVIYAFFCKSYTELCTEVGKRMFSLAVCLPVHGCHDAMMYDYISDYLTCSKC